jgi:phosphohistidine phosphatase
LEYWKFSIIPLLHHPITPFLSCMKRLYLVRHAKSSWKEPDLTDIERPLNTRGKQDAPCMGKRLKELKVHPDLIVSSPAKRARKTAKVIAKEIGFPKKDIVTNESIYLTGVSTLLIFIRNIKDSYQQVMLFGHNPGFTELAEYLTNQRFDNIPTCGIVCMDFDITSWKEVAEGKGDVVFFDYPKKHT